MLTLTAAICLGASSMAVAADHKISAQVTKLDCKSFKPGDTVTLASGTRGYLVISNCSGTASNPIVIRNDPDGNGPTVIRRASGSKGGFLLSCMSCIGVEIDGSYKWNGAPAGKTYGIKITMTGGAGPSAFLRIGGLSRLLTIRNVEIDGAWPALNSTGSGIRINDENINRSRYPGLWREGILIEDNFVHNIESEGMYIGPNYSTGGLPLRNIEIRYNLVEDIGFEGINSKSMWEGNNSIHHNEVRRTGKHDGESNKNSQYSGIKNISGTVKIYNNWIETTGQHGISVWCQDGPKISENRGPFEAHIWNNVIVDAGALWRTFMLDSAGIHLGAQNGCEKPIPYVYNNTIVNSRKSAISLSNNVGAGYVRDNVVAGTGGNPVISVPGFVNLTNNRVGTVTDLAFVDAARRNFRLSVNSPAHNQGGSGFPNSDFDDAARPKDGAPDQGAFEGSRP
jgi:hypothetical protein